jgi:selenocysteine lyase/cysteine desulfurase/glyoxylase-like metal-dependent hydrolase (beta-lactamase superfamily II)/rhodanese-related sulfurtransferase
VILEQLYTDSLSQAAYLVADETTGHAVIVDPLRDVDRYLSITAELGLTIVGVILTHFHADFAAGHLELANRTGAWIGVGDRARPEFDARPLRDGERIVLGETSLEVMATPGHTPESVSLLIYETPADEVAYGVLTGDSLFVGDVGRVDLQASFGADPLELAHQQFDTIQNKFMALPDAVRVFPAHGAGSACGKNLSPDRESTIGRERATNEACRPMPEAAFVALITTGQLPVPAYFVEGARLNRQQHDLFDSSRQLAPVSRDDLTARGADSPTVLDTRDVEAFVRGHIDGALNVPLHGRFAETAGMFLDYRESSVVLVADAGNELESMRQLGWVGFDDVIGYVPVGTFDELARAGELVASDRINVDDFELARLAAQPPVLLDVRAPGEYQSGSIPGAINIPLPELSRRVGELPRDRPIAVHCQSGWRSGVGASYLQANGFTVADLRGGYEAWEVSNNQPLLPVSGGELRVPLIDGTQTRYVNLDYAASAPALTVVGEYVTEFLPFYASVHRGAGYPSQVSTSAYEDARRVVGEFVGARSDDLVIFTRNTTDSLNLLASVVPGDVVVLEIEHHANLLPWITDNTRVVRVAPTIEETLERVDAELASRPAALLTVTGASNVTGERLPLQRLAEIAHRNGARLAVDGAQLVAHRRVDMSADGIDYLAFSGHKVYAPFGTGALIGPSDWLDAGEPYLRGGGAVEHVTLDHTTWRAGASRHEAGSPNVIGAAALARAIHELSCLDEAAWYAHENELRSRLISGLEAVPGATVYRIFSDSTDPVGVVSFSIDGFDSSLLATVLSAEWGIGVRDGKFCAHPLLELLGIADFAVRASFGVGSRTADVDLLLAALTSILANGPTGTYELVDGHWTPSVDSRPRPDWAPRLTANQGYYGCVA